MKTYRADLHIHSTLSPCGSLEMSPVRILEAARKKHLNMIAITDHNTTRQCHIVHRLGRELGIQVLFGAEINTREEVHCLCLFETIDQTHEFQRWLDAHLPPVPNRPEYFGDQVWVDEAEQILGEESRLLLTALSQTLEASEAKVHQLDGLFVAAHADRPSYSIVSQLGFLPDTVRFDAIELSGRTPDRDFSKQHPSFDPLCRIAASDAHTPDQIGTAFTIFHGEDNGFSALKYALAHRLTRLHTPILHRI